MSDVSGAPHDPDDEVVTRKILREELERFATKEDLERFATKEDLERFATKEDLKRELENYPTKEDVARQFKAFEESLLSRMTILFEPYQDLPPRTQALEDRARALERRTLVLEERAKAPGRAVTRRKSAKRKPSKSG